LEENAMETHVKVVGWLWIVNGVFSILGLLTGLGILNLTDSIPNASDAVLVTAGALCFFLPGMIADFVAGYGVLQYRNWGRILVIILAIFNLVFLCYLILPAVLGIYTLYVMYNEETKALFAGEGASATS
jgi:hypothetical protein